MNEQSSILPTPRELTRMLWSVGVSPTRDDDTAWTGRHVCRHGMSRKVLAQLCGDELHLTVSSPVGESVARFSAKRLDADLIEAVLYEECPGELREV